MASATSDPNFDDRGDASSIAEEHARNAAEANAISAGGFSYDDRISRMFIAATLAWGLVATLAGLLIALLMVLPELFAELGDGSELLSFGRLRPVHTNLALWAFAGNGLFAAVYYSTQRLCKTRMWSTALSQLHFWSWQAIAVAALVTLPLAISQGRRHAELEWAIDVAIAVVWIGFFGVNFFMTLATRRQRHLYISLWFYIATILTVTLLHVFNNLVVPSGWGNSYPLYAGVQDALMQWWYGHNLLAFLLTMPFLGLMYYFLPKAANRPIASYKLAVLHFWGLVFFYIWAGPHQVHYTALPDWVSSIGMLFGLIVWMPLWGGMINGLLTLRGARGGAAADPVRKYFFAALIFYGISTLSDVITSVKSVNALTHYTDWMIAQIHTGTLGWNGMLVFGMVYWLLPRLFQTRLWSPRLANWHFWVALAGILLYVVPIYAAGLLQGSRWMALDDTGRLRYPGDLGFIEILQSVLPLWWIRVAGGSLFVIGLVMLGVNYVMTWWTRPAVYQVPVLAWPPLERSSDVAEVSRDVAVEDPLAGAPVLATGRKLALMSRLHWHRRWEMHTLRFSLMVLLLVVVASAIVMVPMFLIRSNTPTVAGTGIQPYTPLELAGRDIYIAEGCFNCHSQMIRPLVAETQRYGDYSQAVEFVYDRPVEWGTRRIGPDLAREGSRRSSIWHWLHLEDPRHELASPESIMPSFAHLLDAELDFEKITERVEAAYSLGVPYDQELTEAPAMARAQAERVAADIVSQGGPVHRILPNGERVLVMDTQAVALIAYLQRLGTDRFRPPEGEPAAEGEPATEGEPAAEGEPATEGAPADSDTESGAAGGAAADEANADQANPEEFEEDPAQ